MIKRIQNKEKFYSAKTFMTIQPRNETFIEQNIEKYKR